MVIYGLPTGLFKRNAYCSLMHAVVHYFLVSPKRSNSELLVKRSIKLMVEI